MELKGSADGRKGARDRQRQRKGETEHLWVTWVPTFILRSEGAEEQDARRWSMRFFYKWAPGVPESWRNRGQGWEVTWPNVSSEFCQNEDEEACLAGSGLALSCWAGSWAFRECTARGPPEQPSPGLPTRCLLGTACCRLLPPEGDASPRDQGLVERVPGSQTRKSDPQHTPPAFVLGTWVPRAVSQPHLPSASQEVEYQAR